MATDRIPEWLPKGFENSDLDAPRRMAQRVRARVAVHRKQVRMAQGVGALAAMALILGVAPLLWHPSEKMTGPSQMAGQSDVGATFRSRSLGSNPSPPEGGSHNGQAVSQPSLDGATSHVPTPSEMAQASGAGAADGVGATFRSRFPGSHQSPPEGGSHNTQGLSQQSLDVSLEKAGQGVELAWRGNPSQEFVVYRCTSPKFDPRFGECSVAGVVKGTRWVDSGKEAAPVVFYRVEPKA